MRWKVAERRIAELLGGVRIPITGRGALDIEHPFLAPEVKSRKRISIQLWEWLEQARKEAEGKLPCLILHRPGMRYKESLICFCIEEFREAFMSAPTPIREVKLVGDCMSCGQPLIIGQAWLVDYKDEDGVHAIAVCSRCVEKYQEEAE